MMSRITPEFRLLVAAFHRVFSQQAPAPGFPEDWQSLLAAVNWPHLLWLGRQHEALTFLHAALADPLNRSHCPADILAQLAAFAEACRMRALDREREHCLVQDVFTRENLLALSADRRITLRDEAAPVFTAPGAALDFFVPATELERASVALEAAGHRCTFDPTQLIHRGHSPVRLNAGLGRHPHTDRCFVQAPIFQIGGRTLRRLAPMHALLQRVACAESSEPASLHAAWEIAALFGGPLGGRWSDVEAEAARFGLDRAARVIAGSYRVLSLAPPPEIVLAEKLAPAGPADIEKFPPRTQPVRIFNAPFLPTPPVAVHRMLALADVAAGDVVYDLGCGDGRLAIAAAAQFGARGLGLDCDPVRVTEADAHAAAAGVEQRVEFRVADIFEADLSPATVVCIFLNDTFLPRLKAWLFRTARPGTRVVSHDHAFPDWPPEKMEIVSVGPGRVCPIYLWRIPLSSDPGSMG